MCVTAGLAIGGALASAFGSVMQGNAQASAYEAEASAAEQNKRIAEAQARETSQRGAREMRRFNRDARQFAATQESQLAASGSTLSGSALSVMTDTEAGIAEDLDTMRANNMYDAWGYDVQAVNFANQASAARSAAKNAKTAGRIGAFTTLLGTGIGIYSQNQMMKAGAIEPAYGVPTAAGTVQYQQSMGEIPRWDGSTAGGYRKGYNKRNYRSRW